MHADRFSPDAVDLLRLLDKHGVRYLLIGGYAVLYHGHPRVTIDIDIAYQPDTGNSSRLFAALKQFWGGSVPGIGAPEELAVSGMVFQFGRPPNRVDLPSRVDGIDFDQAWERRVLDHLEGAGQAFPLPIVSLADLRSAKLAAGRAKDLDDLANLPLPSRPHRESP